MSKKPCRDYRPLGASSRCHCGWKKAEHETPPQGWRAQIIAQPDREECE
jgi:hypothetical protein